MDELKRADNLIASLAGLFGAKGYPDVLVEIHEDVFRRLAVNDESASLVMTARKYLADRGLEPLAT